MEARDPFLNLSPLDHRYWQANKDLFEKLAESLSEQATVLYCVRAEAALLRVHVRRSFNANPQFMAAVDTLEKTISSDAVAKEEQETHHFIRALVNIIQKHLPEELAPFVHLGATSVDILDTAMALRIEDAMRITVLPLILDLLDKLVDLAARHADLPQVGRTHGQAAVPISFGFAMAEYVSRIGQSAVRLEELSRGLKGKLAGAVGACNATTLISADPEELEREYLQELGLESADYANQIVEPEHQLRLLLELNICFGIIANLADDLRHLQRSEIGEVSESFGTGQVGSSTMPQKRNPWNSEHVKSLWKAFTPRVITFYMDQISEHQRDLSNSASGRFVVDYIAGFTAAAARMLKIIKGLTVNGDRMAANLSGLGEGVLAEPTYILLALAGFPDAHEIVRQAALQADSQNLPLHQVLQKNQAVWEVLQKGIRETLDIDAANFYSNPALYRGLSVQKARRLADKYGSISRKLRERIEN